MDEREKMYNKIIEKLKYLWFDDSNTHFTFKETIKGEIVLFVTNTDRFELLDLEEDPSNEKN